MHSRNPNKKYDSYTNLTNPVRQCFCGTYSGIPEAETFGRKGKFSAFGFRFRQPKVKAEYG